jgi:hypothetical protein
LRLAGEVAIGMGGPSEFGVDRLIAAGSISVR